MYREKYNECGSVRSAAREMGMPKSTFFDNWVNERKEPCSCKKYSTVVVPEEKCKVQTKSAGMDLFLDPDEYKVAVLDIETSGLDAAFDIVLTCAIKPLFTKEDTEMFAIELYEDNLKRAEKALVQDIHNHLLEFDGLATFYGQRFDLPFLRTRELAQGLPLIKKVKHLDMWFTAKRTICSKTRRLERINDILMMGKTSDTPRKTRVAIEHWSNVILCRDQNSLNYILDHNEKDVLILENAIKELRDMLPDKVMRS